ncbi:MAG TPA: hypothetical protein VHJ78_12695 [Actinomycetota bacterium]|nr:hypothetical protein [Actinomycetota bacterium]
MAEDVPETFEGVGDPAREKTLGEQPVSDQDIAEIHEDIEDLRDELADLRARENEIG